MFEGSFVAIVTPFKNGKVDASALRGLIEFHIENGTNGIVPCGTTGESATLNHAEHEEVIRIAVETCKGRIPVLAGTGSNATQEAIEVNPTRSENWRGWGVIDHALLQQADSRGVIPAFFCCGERDGSSHYSL